MTCTSIVPESRTTRLMTDPLVSSAQRDCRAGAQNELRGVLRPGEVDQRRGDVAAGHLVELPAHLLEQAAMFLEGRARLVERLSSPVTWTPSNSP